MKKIFFSIAATLLVLISMAQVPETMHFQGFLTDPVSGDPKPDANYTLVFSIYDDATGGFQYWTETHNNVPVSSGLFDVMLGSQGTPLSIAFDVPYWLEVSVDSETLSPRYELATTAYAFTAKTAETALEVVGTDNLFPGSGSVGIGTSSPQQSLQVVGSALITNGRLEVQETSSASEGGEILLAYPDANPAIPTGFTIDMFDDGTINQLRFFNPTITMMWLEDDGDLNVTGTVTAASFSGDGSGLTGISGISPWTGSTSISYSGGNVGIGTSTPTSLLELTGGAGPQFKLSDGGGSSWTLFGGTDLLFNNGTSDIVNMKSTGVDVSGTITATAFAGDGSAITGISGVSPWTGSPDISYAGGKVGIGTATPGTELDINFTNPGTSTSIRVENPSTTGFSALSLRNDNRSFALAVGGSAATLGQNSFYILDGASSTARMAIDPSGLIGIGTTSPFYEMDLQGSVAGGITSRVQNTDASGFASYRLSNDNRGYSLSIGGSTSSTPDKFYIWDVAAAAPRFVLDENGNVGIGTTTPGNILSVRAGTNSHVARFQNDDAAGRGIIISTGPTNPINTFMTFEDAGSTSIGTITGDGSGGVTYNSASDLRLKQNIKELKGALQLLSNIQPKSYEFKSSPGNRKTGFLAQELQLVYPEAVSGDPNGDVTTDPMMVDYSKLTPLLTGAIQEQQKIIEDQEERIARLEELVEKLVKSNDESGTKTASRD